MAIATAASIDAGLITEEQAKNKVKRAQEMLGESWGKCLRKSAGKRV